MSALATAAELAAWFDDAQEAIDTMDGQLAATWLRALAAQPERPFAGHRRTWYLEEAERVQKERMRDGFPQSDADAEAWRDRQDRREARVMDLMDRHTEALVEAAAYVRRTGVWAPRSSQPALSVVRTPKSARPAVKPARRTAAERALAAVEATRGGRPA